MPVSCAGLVVMPGDLVVGDADGVIAVPAAEVADVLRKTRVHLEKEARIREGNRSGTTDQERFDAVLRAKGLPVRRLEGLSPSRFPPRGAGAAQRTTGFRRARPLSARQLRQSGGR
ncbi:hypothetical protein [Cupriavidus sp. UME77]|uniref:hypothetical protein n=1 Tax=Cupriavidus sp. UME77 TaxID=1862321 RepID=UPI00351C0F63